MDGRELKLQPGSLLSIEAGEAREISNPGREPLVTINVYALPTYGRDRSVSTASPSPRGGRGVTGEGETRRTSHFSRLASEEAGRPPAYLGAGSTFIAPACPRAP